MAHVVDISNRRLETLPQEVLNTAFITTLKATENNLKEIPDLNLSNLVVLDLSYNSLKSATGVVSCPNLVELYLAHNCLSSIPNLSPCLRLQVLKLDMNQIRSIPRNHLPLSLVELDLSNNAIADFTQLKYLAPLAPSLTTLSVVGNTFCHQAVQLNIAYRPFVRSIISSIQSIDSAPLTAQELEVAHSLFQKPGAQGVDPRLLSYLNPGHEDDLARYLREACPLEATNGAHTAGTSSELVALVEDLRQEIADLRAQAHRSDDQHAAVQSDLQDQIDQLRTDKEAQEKALKLVWTEMQRLVKRLDARELKEKQKAATAIQKLWKGRMARRRYAELLAHFDQYRDLHS